ncbi:MAG: hypothetical protein IAE78_22305 [Myxococcus sp.]|nr:hypothetical protein [Myxococcus sp.]
MTKVFWFVAALAVGSVVGFACGSAPPKCSVASCAGCCSTDGTCLGGNTSMACGTQGNACVGCGLTQTCVAGACMATSGSGGGSAMAGGSAAGGSAAGGSAAGGSAAGGSAAGGSAGGSAAGGSAAGGSAAGGSAAGGAAGGMTQLMFDAGMPPTVPISFATACNATQPCGGALPGLWHYQSVCVEDAIFSQLVTRCGGPTQTQILDRTGTASGAVFFTATQMARMVTGRVDFKMSTVNSTCVNGFGGFGCVQLPTLLSQAGITGTCALALPDGGASSSTCTCELNFRFNDQATDTYTTSGNVISTAGNRTFDYCVQGQTLTYEETTPTSVMNIARDPGVSTLGKQ